ncbi:MAG TPA: Na/Pi cotransporter family protein, partial [Geopsychrobacteraceae bacterium]|nr:Na/Pi cotransporter family protein [Geopsychrobacteraceae bacterium]
MSTLISQHLVFGLMGGLGLFLLGMKIMSEGLQKVAGDRMRKILASLTNNRIVGMMVGIGVTTIIQSSSATT